MAKKKNTKCKDLSRDEMISLGEKITQWDWAHNWWGPFGDPRVYFGIVQNETIGDIGISIGYKYFWEDFEHSEDCFTRVTLTSYFIHARTIAMNVTSEQYRNYFLGQYYEFPELSKKVQRYGPIDESFFKPNPRLVTLYKKAEKSFKSSCKGKPHRKEGHNKDLFDPLYEKILKKQRIFILEKARNIIKA